MNNVSNDKVAILSQDAFDLQNFEPEGKSSDAHSAGSLLVAAREQKEWTVPYVADQLKLSIKQIIALESNQFDILPEVVIVRGFIRSYSKLLRIDPEAVIALLPKEKDTETAISSLKPTLTTPFQQSRMPILGRHDSNAKPYIWGSVFLLLCLVGFFAFQKLEKMGYLNGILSFSSAPESKKSADLKMGTVIENMPTTAVAVSTPSASVTDTLVASSAAEPAAIAPPQIMPTVVASAASVSGLSKNSSTGSVASAATDTGASNTLKLKFKQDSWIQLKRENGSVVSAHLGKAASEESFDVNGKLWLRVGNAIGVEVSLRGTPLPIVGANGSNVANVEIN